MMKKPLKTPVKPSRRTLFLRPSGSLTLWRRQKSSKTPPAVDYRGIFDQKKYAVKEPDPETGLYYYGARYLDPKTSRWLSGDPALGEYLPSAPLGEEEKKRNRSLPGMGGVFNYVNLHVYHYAGNNPVRYVDPDGEWLAFKEQIDRFNKHLSRVASGTRLLNPDSVMPTIKAPPDPRKVAENEDQKDLDSGFFSRSIDKAMGDMGIYNRTEAENYRKEETDRYKAFKELRENGTSQTELDRAVSDAQNEYNRVLGPKNRPEDKKRADEAANKVIDDFIHSKNPSYKPPNNEEP